MAAVAESSPPCLKEEERGRQCHWYLTLSSRKHSFLGIFLASFCSYHFVTWLLWLERNLETICVAFPASTVEVDKGGKEKEWELGQPTVVVDPPLLPQLLPEQILWYSWTWRKNSAALFVHFVHPLSNVSQALCSSLSTHIMLFSWWSCQGWHYTCFVIRNGISGGLNDVPEVMYLHKGQNQDPHLPPSRALSLSARHTASQNDYNRSCEKPCVFFLPHFFYQGAMTINLLSLAAALNIFWQKQFANNIATVTWGDFIFGV